MNQAFDAGFITYLLMILVPGIGLGELLGVWQFGELISERLGMAFALGLSVDALVLFIRTAKAGVLIGLDLPTIYGIIVGGFALFFISIVIRKKFSFPKRPGRVDLALFLIVIIQALMLFLYFQKYPIFPQFQSQDFQNHVQSAQGLISGSISSIPGGILYYGVRYQIAAAILLVGGEPLVTAQQTMAILISISPLFFFLAGKKIFLHSTAAGLIAALIYVLSGTVWYDSVLDSGLYANFYGILAAIFLIVALVNLETNVKSYASWIAFLFSMINAYMSHYTILTLLPAFILLPVFQYLFSQSRKDVELKRWIIPGLVLLMPALLAFLLYPYLQQLILALTFQSGGTISGSTLLSNALSFAPVLSYLSLEIFDDVALIALIALAIIGSYYSIMNRNALFSIPLIWFLSLLISAPNGVPAWRFAFEAVVPLLLLASYGLATFFPQARPVIRERSTLARRAKTVQRGSMIPQILIVLIFMGAIILGSWGQTLVSDALSNQGISSQSQSSVYNAIYWLSANTNGSSHYLSVSDWRFTFTDLMIGRTTVYQYERLPSDAIKQAANSSATYIIVTNVTTVSLPSVAEFYPWNNFPTSSNSNLSLIYQNSDVRIYHIVKGS